MALYRVHVDEVGGFSLESITHPFNTYLSYRSGNRDRIYNYRATYSGWLLLSPAQSYPVSHAIASALVVKFLYSVGRFISCLSSVDRLPKSQEKHH